MATCCGGKNAGKPISWTRYAAGLGVFLGYHGAMRVLLSTASIPIPELRKVRDFHRQVFHNDLKEILARDDINVNGRLGASTEPAVCEVDVAPGVRTVVIGPEDFEDTAAQAPRRAHLRAIS